MRYLCLGFVWILCCFAACQPKMPPQDYLFLGHTYHWDPSINRLDSRIESLKKDTFEGLWLGGDMLPRTCESIQNLRYLDQQLGIHHTNTHWTLGNHDLGTADYLDTIEQATQRPTFYTQWENGFLVMVLNTNLFIYQNKDIGDQCDRRQAQWDMIQSVCDTITKASHLVVLHHHCLLTQDQAPEIPILNHQWHFYRPDAALLCDGSATFRQMAYPKLANVQAKGIQVVFVGGDIGQRRKSFEYKTKEGVWFLGSGINNSIGKPENPPPYVTNFEPDSLLIFRYWPKTQQLQWKYRSVESMTGLPEFTR